MYASVSATLESVPLLVTHNAGLGTLINNWAPCIVGKMRVRRGPAAAAAAAAGTTTDALS